MPAAFLNQSRPTLQQPMKAEVNRSLRDLSDALKKFRDGPLNDIVATMLATIESQLDYTARRSR